MISTYSLTLLPRIGLSVYAPMHLSVVTGIYRNESLWHYVFCLVSCLFLYSSFFANNLRGMSTLAEVNEFQRDSGGALSSFRYPIKLSGHTKFLRNIGGGLSVINTEIDVEKNAQVLFQENAAIFGGGVQMEERCRVSLCCAFAVCYLPILLYLLSLPTTPVQLFVSPGARMNFTENFAYLGGAIYAFSMPVVFANYIRNRLCIIQYNDPQQEDVPAENWQVCSCPCCTFMHGPICSFAAHATSYLLSNYSTPPSLCCPIHLYVECEHCLCGQHCRDWWCCVVHQ